jgi:DMSO/TMAO reductase YedYZ molybdopterin-dependent catalytic subunit
MFNRLCRRSIPTAILVLSLAITIFAQSSASISVTGDVKQALSLTASDLATMPRATSSTNNNGIVTVYEGVWLSEVLKKAGVPLGAGMRGSALAGYVLASASDGYQVLFSLGEIDPEMTDNQFLLADKADGKPLFGANGAFRLVVPKDKRGARSVRLLTKLEVVQLRK